MQTLRRSFFVAIGAIFAKKATQPLRKRGGCVDIYRSVCAYSADVSGSVYQREYIR